MASTSAARQRIHHGDPEELILHSAGVVIRDPGSRQGLIEAGYVGNPKAFPLLRGFYDGSLDAPIAQHDARRGSGRQA